MVPQKRGSRRERQTVAKEAKKEKMEKEKTDKVLDVVREEGEVLEPLLNANKINLHSSSACSALYVEVERCHRWSLPISLWTLNG